jgi:hypothetical protein
VFIRLIRKRAEQLDGIDMSAHCAGDVLEVPRYEAELLIAEAWVVADELQSGAVPAVSSRCRGPRWRRHGSNGEPSNNSGAFAKRWQLSNSRNRRTGVPNI